MDRQINLPLSSLAKKTHFQGAAWAKDPKTGDDWFFQMQANPVGPGDVEDLLVHRYRLNGDTLTFVDTMYGKGFGHVQTMKVRISAASNPYLYIGLEVYNSSHVQTGNQLFKVKYRKGTIDRKADGITRWYPKAGTAVLGCVDSPDWTIVLRRPYSTSETYEWYSENDLLDSTSSKPAQPRQTMTVSKSAAVFQTACATGKYSDTDVSIFRFNGAATDNPQWLTQFRPKQPDVQIDLTDIVTGSGGGTVEEPEALLTVRDELWVGKQTSPYTSSRIVAYMPLDLT